MDKKEAYKQLNKHKEALETLLKSEGLGDIKAEAEKALENAKDSTKVFKKGLLDRVKELPIVSKVSELGTAGTVAIVSAGTVQSNLAIDQTELFIAEVANDVIEERFEVPAFIDNFIDFEVLNDWGQEVISEKVAEAQSFVSEVSEPQQTSQPSSDSQDTKPQTSSSSQDSSDDKSSQKQSIEQDQESQSDKSEKQESKPSNQSDTKQDQDKNQSKQEERVEESEIENKASSDTKDTKEEVKSDPPIVETPFDNTTDDIRPHSSVRQVSPTS